MKEQPFYNHPLVKGTILENIGNTPLIQLRRITKHLPQKIRIFCKLEGMNPGGSVKDRPALQMILDGIESNLLTNDKIILDSTSGNTGIGLALVGNILNFQVELCVPANASHERKCRLEAYGAKIVYTDPLEGSDGALLKARECYKKEPQKYFKPDQYSSPSNPKAHMLTTAPEIWRQTNGKITHFVATIGTTGTIMGHSRFFTSLNRGIKTYACEPDDALHGLEGLKHLESSLVPDLYNKSEIDGTIRVNTETSYELARRLAREEGIFVGQSSGGAIDGALQLADRLISEGTKEAIIVAILPDVGDRYFSKGLWSVKDNIK